MHSLPTHLAPFGSFPPLLTWGFVLFPPFALDAQEIGGGFNGAVPGVADGAFGGGWTVNSSMVVLGLGGVLGNTSFGVEVVQDKETGKVRVLVNGKEVA